MPAEWRWTVCVGGLRERWDEYCIQKSSFLMGGNVICLTCTIFSMTEFLMESQWQLGWLCWIVLVIIPLINTANACSAYSTVSVWWLVRSSQAKLGFSRKAKKPQPVEVRGCFVHLCICTLGMCNGSAQENRIECFRWSMYLVYLLAVGSCCGMQWGSGYTTKGIERDCQLS